VYGPWTRADLFVLSALIGAHGSLLNDWEEAVKTCDGDYFVSRVAIVGDRRLVPVRTVGDYTLYRRVNTCA
jgi:hypothetical protein